VPTDGGFQLTSAKRKKDLRQLSSKRRKMNHERKYQKNNVIERSPEVLKTDEDEVLKTDEDEVLKTDEDEVLKTDEDEVLKTDEDEVLKTDEDEAESTDSDVRRQCEMSDFNEKMSAWSGLGIASSILRALAEQGFVEPTEIQVRFRNQKYCESFGFLSAMSLLGDVAMSFGRCVPTCCSSM